MSANLASSREQNNQLASVSPWRQRFKWTVYALLFFDFILYFIQDAESARYTLNAHSTLFEYARAYVTSIDVAAWFALIILFELETYVLIGRTWTGGTKWAVHGLRLLCYVTILHTSFAYDVTLHQFQNPRPLPAAADVCAYTDGDWSFLRNREYTDLEAGNCSDIGAGPDFYEIGGDAVITDRAGLREGLILAWTDLAESVVWLLVVFVTELAVRLKRSAFANGAILTLLLHFKVSLYVLILAIAFYWGSKQQYLYLWDELIWVFGFLLIDWNIRDWRSERPAGPIRPLEYAK